MTQSEIKVKLLDIVKKQETKMHHIALDITLLNGNILLKSFRLFEFDIHSNELKGMTMQEEYSYIREEREPVYAHFNLEEVKELETATANYLFLNEPMNVLVNGAESI
ncbi:hypothetical protein [Cytophaga hutchinsonii]|uniref:Uncharacterized protein n=1 Tax=Cytophaga hutchinsonii (strain ATCC 33406 / DSM 1761 / CIP 103989 / NBRC 15051 / NCIMB 9469 / D465) TaxID=269798 RepID=A0A6N4SX73_CYTH3|nr:hypothetical protein [Cytophaga hutchinsonii]ABG61046.1 hypothetical protein CHU_3814 [Cytophaga hutchinsonii ATCC 33406]SFX45073.1 hypothetical protein SAMN04487930_104161 [Cytophaga hutchinsonii ATCC 33406]